MAGRRGRHGIGIALATALSVFALPSGAGAAAQGPSDSKPVVSTVEQSPRQIERYWTAARMRAAVPADVNLGGAVDRGAEGTAGRPSYVAPAPAPRAATDVSAESIAFPRRVHGKVFFTLADADYVCSATVVRSGSHSLVWTAGHCVNGADVGAGFATNWLFVPAYRDGAQPYGGWTATRLLTTPGWEQGANIRVDIGAAVLARDPQGRGIEDVVGARGIAFNQSRNQTFDAFGYPAIDLNTALLPPNFDGQRLWRCHSIRTANDSPNPTNGPATLEISCNMTSGSSGGSWVIGDAFVNSVTSYSYGFDTDHLYGPYFGDDAKRLYERAGGKAQRCRARAATNVGNGGTNDFTGGNGGDVFRLLAGRDSASGKPGDDTACGGGGADVLRGNDGDDRLKGDGGADLLIGGPGFDVCDGGPGRDRARGCERQLRVP